LAYTSSWQKEEKKRCIICNDDKWEKGRLIPVQTITLTDKAEATLAEYANLHVKDNNAKYIAGANRILIILATTSLFAADVGYHKKLCYEPFRSPAWKRKRGGTCMTVSTDEDDALEEMYQLIVVHIIKRHEIYTMAQLTSAFNQIRSDKRLAECRSTDLKEILQQKFGSQLMFHQPTQSRSRASDYVFPKSMEFTAKCIETAVLGGGIAKYVSLKNTARTIHISIKDTRKHMSWPPTPQVILEQNRNINTDLYNELCWIVNPDARLDDNGRVQLSQSKSAKVHQICQDIQAMLPNAQPSLDQVLLSLTIHRKTGSSAVVDTLHSLGYGTSYTETVFIEDKWAEWSEKQHSSIPSNIVKGVQTTHVTDNIDWKNKGISGMNETHNTNSILIQHKIPVTNDNNMEHKAQVSVVPDYSFKREDHHCFIATEVELPHYIPTKASSAPIHSYKEDCSHNECDKSKLETLAWVKSRKIKDGPHNQTVPAWSAFQQLTTTEYPPGVNVGYLPAITAPPTNMSVILSIMNRTMECMTELELDFIFLEADQAIYTKVLQVLFKFKQEGSTRFDKMIVRMGGFHIIMCLMKTIYSRFQGSGIVELLSEAGVGAEGTIKAGLNGTNVKQGIRYYKLLFEALLRSKIDFIESTCDDPQPAPDDTEINLDTQSSDDLSENLNITQPEHMSNVHHDTPTTDDVNDFNNNRECGTMSLEMAIENLRDEQTPEALEQVVSHPALKLTPSLPGGMATWMDSFIEMVDLLLNMIHFQRSGNWEGFLEVVYQFLPWCFGLNRHNYARNMSYFYVDMRDLKLRIPAAYQYLLDGGFSGSLSGEKHTKIPMDQIIEMTINRFSKEIGGLSGKTENVGASERWMRINHYLAALKQSLEQRTKVTSSYKHVELGAKRMKKDEDAVDRIVAGLLAWVPTLWSSSQPLINIATGIIAPSDMIRNVMTTKERGEQARREFFRRITENVTDNTSSETQESQLGTNLSQSASKTTTARRKPENHTPKYSDPIKKQLVLTFDKITEQKKRVSIVQDEGQSFAAILADYDEKKLDLRYIMEWPITSKPWAICNEQGVSRASTKSLFRNNLQLLSTQRPTSVPPMEIECSIVDAMRVVRIIPIKNLTPPTFKSWADKIVDYLRSLPGTALHLIFDDYRSEEGELYLSKGRPDKGRERRISDLTQTLPKLRDWSDFLTNDVNKQQVR
jgi:hypothetical protein